MNRLLNLALGHNSSKDAKQVLKALLADDLKEARKKAEEEAKETPEAKAYKAAKKAEAQAKRKATNERKKADKKAAKQQAVVVQPPDAAADDRNRTLADAAVAGRILCEFIIYFFMISYCFL